MEKDRQDIEMKNGMLTIAETAYLLSVHINTIRRWSNQGMLKSYRIGTRGDRRFRREDIDIFIAGLNRSPARRQETVNEGKKKILIADNDSNIRALVKRMLGPEYLVLDAAVVASVVKAEDFTQAYLLAVIVCDHIHGDGIGDEAVVPVRHEVEIVLGPRFAGLAGNAIAVLHLIALPLQALDELTR